MFLNYAPNESPSRDSSPGPMAGPCAVLTVKVCFLNHCTQGAKGRLSFVPAAAVGNNGCKVLGEVRAGPEHKAGAQTAVFSLLHG